MQLVTRNDLSNVNSCYPSQVCLGIKPLPWHLWLRLSLALLYADHLNWHQCRLHVHVQVTSPKASSRHFCRSTKALAANSDLGATENSVPTASLISMSSWLLHATIILANRFLSSLSSTLLFSSLTLTFFPAVFQVESFCYFMWSQRLTFCSFTRFVTRNDLPSDQFLFWWLVPALKL